MSKETRKDIPSDSRPGGRILTVGTVLLSWVLTLCLLLWIGQIPAGKNIPQCPDSTGTAERFHRNLNNRISEALSDIVSIQKIYWINQEEHQAPETDPDCYGEIEDPAQIQEVYDRAESLLKGQEFLLCADSQLMPDSSIHYYLDDTILAVVWKEALDSSVYTFAEVKIAHPSQFRRFLAGDAFGSGKLLLTSEMAKSVNAVVATNGDYYAYRTMGVTVWDGTVYRNNRGIPDNCFVTRNGDLLLERGVNFASTEEAQAYMDENDIQFSLSFGPILVKDGEAVTTRYYPVGEIMDKFTRAAICQMDELHYLFVSVNGEKGLYQMPTIQTFAQRILETGCQQGYTLDGGQTATVVMDNQVINQVNYGSQRRISDIIYFATAKPKGA